MKKLSLKKEVFNESKTDIENVLQKNNNLTQFVLQKDPTKSHTYSLIFAKIIKNLAKSKGIPLSSQMSTEEIENLKNLFNNLYQKDDVGNLITRAEEENFSIDITKINTMDSLVDVIGHHLFISEEGIPYKEVLEEFSENEDYKILAEEEKYIVIMPFSNSVAATLNCASWGGVKTNFCIGWKGDASYWKKYVLSEVSAPAYFLFKRRGKIEKFVFMFREEIGDFDIWPTENERKYTKNEKDIIINKILRIPTNRLNQIQREAYSLAKEKIENFGEDATYSIVIAYSDFSAEDLGEYIEGSIEVRKEGYDNVDHELIDSSLEDSEITSCYVDTLERYVEKNDAHLMSIYNLAESMLTNDEDKKTFNIFDKAIICDYMDNELFVSIKENVKARNVFDSEEENEDTYRIFKKIEEQKIDTIILKHSNDSFFVSDEIFNEPLLADFSTYCYRNFKVFPERLSWSLEDENGKDVYYNILSSANTDSNVDQSILIKNIRSIYKRSKEKEYGQQFFTFEGTKNKHFKLSLLENNNNKKR